MAWNRTEIKSLIAGPARSILGPGAPVAQNPAFEGKGYRDPWDIERAYREGMQKVTWVSRCVDAIAGNQARLPVILRSNNSPDGQIVRKGKSGKSTLLDILNTRANVGSIPFVQSAIMDNVPVGATVVVSTFLIPCFWILAISASQS